MHSRMIIRIKLRYTISSQEFELLQYCPSDVGRRSAGIRTRGPDEEQREQKTCLQKYLSKHNLLVVCINDNDQENFRGITSFFKRTEGWVGGGSFVISSPECGSLKFSQGFRGETTQICFDNAQMLGKRQWSRLRILDLVFNSTCLAF